MKFKYYFQTFCLVLFSVVVVVVQLVQLTDDQMNMYKALAGLVCLSSFFIFCRDKLLIRKAIWYGLIASLLMILSIIYNENARVTNLLWIWSYLGVGLLLYKYGIPKIVASAIFYGCCLFFCLIAMRGELQSNEVIEHGSANHVSVLCIYCMFLYYISLKNEKDKLLPYLPIIIVAFLSLWTANRSGIISSGISFLFILYFNRKLSSKSHNQFKNFILIAVLAVLVIYFFSHYYSQFDVALEAKMERQGIQSARSFLWAEYIKGIFDSLGNFFLGVPGNDPAYRFLHHYYGNPHNSYLVVHEKFGLLGFLIIIYVIIKTAWLSVKRKEWVITATLILVFIRSFFDWTAFPGLYDVMFWYYIFYISFNERTVSNLSHVKFKKQ